MLDRTFFLALRGAPCATPKTPPKPEKEPQWKAWNHEEERILRHYWAIEGAMVVKRLPGKSIMSVQTKASRLGLSKRCR